MRTLRIALAQINTTVGDLDGNTEKILNGIAAARQHGADLVAFPELAITGYPPEDLLFKPRFIDGNLDRLREIVRATDDIAAIIGFVDRGDDIYNAAAIACHGQLAGVYHKAFLPNYGVFDENRYFQAGTSFPVFRLNEVTIGVNICEDIWYPDDPMKTQVLDGAAEVIVNISASPYHAGKGQFRETMIATRAADNAVVVAFANLVGGQDELLFDGRSLIFNETGDLLARGKQFEEDLVVADLDIEAVFRWRLHDPRRRKAKDGVQATSDRVPVIDLGEVRHAARARLTPPVAVTLEADAEVYTALCLGTRDYVMKNGFKGIVVGVSGGIDSAMVTTIAVDALGPDNVVGVTMPSQYSSDETKTDAYRLAENLGIRFLTIPIKDTFDTYRRVLAEEFKGLKEDVTEENLQARIRGNLLMGLSNKFGWLVLTTGDKSEMSVGFATLYGDMSGGFAVIKDVYKTRLYALGRYRNGRAGHALIPEGILTREPSPELKPNQKASDTLPPYPVLDPILRAYVEEDKSLDEIVDMGFPEATVRDVIRRVDRSEYKRRQAPPGIKITTRAFGKDRRLPLTNRNVYY
ncbi:MAG: NAD+ synthase [Candidatus Latescibacteria bacterium]|nr:NAD+ synthase [Candidatus Latescibacterota bacterium]